MYIYKGKLAHFNYKYYRKEKKKRDLKRYVRITGRRASEGTLGFKKLYEPLYKPLEEKKSR